MDDSSDHPTMEVDITVFFLLSRHDDGSDSNIENPRDRLQNAIYSDLVSIFYKSYCPWPQNINWNWRQKVLVLGGGGAVGLTAIQLPVAAGCNITTTCGSQSIERVLAVGAKLAIDYTTEDFELTIKGQFDAVLDTIGKPETERLGINLLKRGGHYMTLQGEAASITDRYGLTIGLPIATAILLKKQLRYRYSHAIEYWWTFMRADSEGLEEIRRLLEAGKTKIPVEKTFSIT